LNIPSHVSDNIETVQQLYDYIKKHSWWRTYTISYRFY
jgi:hypothetical protein